jgi:pimeloyl-ACP methyl ester carboxylesterase
MSPVRRPLLRHAPALAVCALLAAGGCSTIRVERSHPPDLFEGWRVSALSAGELSPRTMQTLRLWDLDAVYRRSPVVAAARLHAAALQDPQPDLLFAMAEVNYLRGRAAEGRHWSDAVACYYLCAGYAYHYLFDEYRPPRPEVEQAAAHAAGLPEVPQEGTARSAGEVFDPRFRLACDLYNAGLAKCIAAAQRVGQLDPRKKLVLPTPRGGAYTLSVEHVGFAWSDEEFGPLQFADDFKVEGLRNQHRTYGLGVPLIATRARTKGRPGPAYYPLEASFPVSAFFRFEGGLADLASGRAGRLELYNPLAVQAVDVRGRTVPLETDLTTPLGYFLAHGNLDVIQYTGFLSADHLRGQDGIHLLAPYQRGKIPVVFVHGLLSSPLTWAPVINDLQADPVLRQRYQFWYYFYPTANPYLATAADLRRALVRLRDELDPEHKDGALDDMVFVGHSMGGLVSKLLTVDGGDDFWRLISDRPIDGLKLSPAARAELDETFYFRRLPGVKRVIFLGTPHHGSKLSPSPLGKLADHVAGVPRALMSAAQEVLADEADPSGDAAKRRVPTSVDLLDPKSPALALLAGRPRPEGVRYHSVIGTLPKSEPMLERLLEDTSEPGDGVVPYRSAHVENAESELVVPADHFHVHHHPLAILEVRRILLEHAQAAPEPPAPRPKVRVIGTAGAH